jgi:hypothetical protein
LVGVGHRGIVMWMGGDWRIELTKVDSVAYHVDNYPHAYGDNNDENRANDNQ